MCHLSPACKRTSCGHLFCAICIKSQKTCPTCRKEFTTTQDQRSERLLKAFKVKCPNSEKGCVWEGDLGDTEDHMKKNCPHQQVSCPNGCGQSMERKLLPAHTQDSCTHRKYKCPYCWEEALYKEITEEHLVTCSLLMLDCPAKCGKHVGRGNMKHHLFKQCPEEYVSCKYAINGCDVLVKRKDKEKHESDDSFHIQMLIRSQAQLLQSFAKCLMAKSLNSANVTFLPLSVRPWLQNTPTCYPVPPWVVKFEEINEIEVFVPYISADQVYSHFGGYKFNLLLYMVDNRVDGVCMEYLEIICQNPHLSFPFKGWIQVTLLNQLEDREHHHLNLWEPFSLIYDMYKVKVMLNKKISDKNSPFVQNDCVFIRIDKITIKCFPISPHCMCTLSDTHMQFTTMYITYVMAISCGLPHNYNVQS